MKQTSVRLSDETRRRLRVLAERSGRSATVLIREAVDAHLDDLDRVATEPSVCRTDVSPRASAVVSANAGTQSSAGSGGEMDPSLRWDDIADGDDCPSDSVDVRDDLEEIDVREDLEDVRMAEEVLARRWHGSARTNSLRQMSEELGLDE